MPFAPIQYPSVWPPPDVPSYPEHRFSWIPLIGGLFRHFTGRRYWYEHWENVLNPIAKEIMDQLAKRPTSLHWPPDGLCRDVAQIVSEVVADEKFLPDSPALHPDDPVPLLFWGPFDDLTPLLVRVRCRDELKLELPESLFVDVWDERPTIQQFIEASVAGVPTGVDSAGEPGM